MALMHRLSPQAFSGQADAASGVAFRWQCLLAAAAVWVHTLCLSAEAGGADPPQATATAPVAVSGSLERAGSMAADGLPPERPLPHRLGVAQAIDRNVNRLARSLDLDLAQKDALRQILLDQHRRLMGLRASSLVGRSDVTGTTLAIYDQTKTRIRALLSEEQKARYIAALPADARAPAQAELGRWLDLQNDGRRRQQVQDSTP